MKVCLLFSGGVDSMYLANRACELIDRPVLLHIEYDHPAADYERAAVQGWAARNKRRIDRLDVVPVPVHAMELAQGVYTRGARCVPGRNDLFIAVAVNHAAARKCSEIWIGATAEDRGYPDCRPEWVRQKGEQARPWKIGVRAPIMCMTRKQIAAAAFNRDYDMGGAWSCYQPHPVTLKACGMCNSCRQGWDNEQG